jgi:hypothetical protein
MSKTATTPALVQCPECNGYRRTRKERCTYCQKRHDEREKARAKLAAMPDTIQNLGVDVFATRLAAVMHTEGFSVTTPLHSPPPFNPSADQREREYIAEICTCKWTAGHDSRCQATRGYLRLLAAEAYEAARFNMTLANDALHVTFDLRFDTSEVEYSGIDGTTNFSANADGTGGTYSFDRTGVEASFTCRVTATPQDVADTLMAQLTRVAASRERIARSIAVPGLPGGWTVTPEQRIEIAKLLRAGKGTSFMPSGFGVGYRVYPRRPASRYSSRLPAETSTFFGVSMPLFYDTLDCD